MQSSDDLPTVQGSSSFSLKGELSMPPLSSLLFLSPTKPCNGLYSLTHQFLTLKGTESWTEGCLHPCLCCQGGLGHMVFLRACFIHWFLWMHCDTRPQCQGGGDIPHPLQLPLQTFPGGFHKAEPLSLPAAESLFNFVHTVTPSLG